MSAQLETDKDGNVITKPVIGWTIRSVAGVAVLLAIEYADTPLDIEMGGKSLPLVLTPPQCLELSQALAKASTQLLADQSHPGQAPN